MQPQLTFSFPLNVTASAALAAVAEHFGVDVAITAGELPNAAPVTVMTPPSPVTPTAPSVASAPAAPHAAHVAAPPAPATQSSVTIDKDGLPWDNRIHSTPAALTDKGVWRAKRGVGNNKAFVAQVEAELRAIAAVPSPATVAPADILEQPNTVDRSTWAHNKAIEICGAQPVDDETLQRLLAGTPTTLTIEQSNWYVAYSAARNKAYAEYLTWSQVGQQPAAAVETVAAPAPVAVQAPPAPPAPPAVNTPPAPPAPHVTIEQAGTTFPLLMRWIAQNKVAGLITDEVVGQVCAENGFAGADGVGSIALMAQRNDWWAYFAGLLQQRGAV